MDIENDCKITAAVGIKRRHRPLKGAIQTAITADLVSRGIDADRISIDFHEKGLTNVSADGITLRYKLDSYLNPILLEF